MARQIVIGVTAIVLLAGLYFSWGPLQDGWNMAKGMSDVAVVTAKKESPPVAVAPAQPAPLTGFPAKFRNSLMYMDDGTPRGLDTSKLAGVQYWAFYYSASWCPPCRAFTPDLVSFYKEFKPKHPNFELIFVNDDNSEEDMLNYMRNDGMPWPAIWYSQINDSELNAKKYCGNGIPCLVLVDARGNVLSDTYRWGQYTDPHLVINDIKAQVQ